MGVQQQLLIVASLEMLPALWDIRTTLVTRKSEVVHWAGGN
jgi:hypothetical protein